MDYKVTFEDGSEYLVHYGVKGMKWKKHLKALDPEYLEQLGQNVQGLAGGAAQTVGQLYSNLTGKAEKPKTSLGKPLVVGGTKTVGQQVHSLATDIIKRENSPSRKLQRYYDKVDAQTARQKEHIDNRKTEPINYKNVLKVVDRSHGNVGQGVRDTGKYVYDNAVKKSADKAKTDAAGTAKKVRETARLSNSLSETEKNALRQEARKKKNAQKKENANRVRRLLGLPEK